MASLTGLSVVVADETASLVHLSQEAMPAVYECVYRIMTARALIVAADAKIGLMTDGAIHSIHRSHPPVQIISPSYRVRLRRHYAVAFVTVAS